VNIVKIQGIKKTIIWLFVLLLVFVIITHKKICF